MLPPHGQYFLNLKRRRRINDNDKSKSSRHPPHPWVVCVQVQGTLPSPPPPTHPAHPTYPNRIRMVVCMQVQGMLSSHPTHPTPNPSNLYWEDVCKSKVCYHPPQPTPPTQPTQPIQPVLGGCMQVQGMLPSPPTQPIQPIQIKSVRSYVCKSKVCHHPPPPPTHPTHPTYPNRIRMVVCMQVQGMLSSPPPLNEAQVREKPRRKWYMRGASESEAQVRKNARRKWESCHWGSQVEHLADLALASKSIEGGQSHLPKAARGRCQKPEFIQSPLFQTTKRGRQGDYEPSHEVVTIKAKRQVTQLRRLQSFTARIKKFENVGPTTPMTVLELHQEWNAIQKCSAWGPPFLYWLQQFPELEYAAWPLPTYDWLFQVCQFVRHHVDITVSQDAIIFKNKLEYGCRLDKTEGSNKVAFKQVKGTPIPPLSELRQTIEELVAVVPTDNPLVIEVFGNQVPKLKQDFPLTLDGNVWKIQDITDDCALIEACNHSTIPLETANLVQYQYAFSTIDIAKGLNDYWQPIWQREETNFDYDIPSEEIHQIILDFPAHPAIEVDMLNVSIWQKVIQKQKPHSARGIDRISNQELRLLPTKCIESLATLMLSYHQGFPSWFMQGLTVPMPKTTDIPNSSQTRPITILAMLYRVWSAVAFYHVIRILSTWVPPGVTGLLPKRGAHTAAYATQWAIEQAKFLKKSTSGFVLDLKKCFNCIRWECGYHFLKNAGVPSNLLQQCPENLPDNGLYTKKSLVQGLSPADSLRETFGQYWSW